MSTVSEYQRDWPFLKGALIVVFSLLVLEVGGTIADRHFNPGPTALETTVKCLRNEKQLDVEEGATDPIARTADRGVVRTRIEGNGFTIILSSSDSKAERIAANYSAVSAGPADAVEQRGHVVYVWEGSPSPTQRQTVYDCYY